MPHADLFEQLSGRRLLESLKSQFCPSCGDVKRARQTFCRQCYFSLTPKLRKDLFNLLGNGYSEAVRAAIMHLGRHQFRLASDPVIPPPTTELNHGRES